MNKNKCYNVDKTRITLINFRTGTTDNFSQTKNILKNNNYFLKHSRKNNQKIKISCPFYLQHDPKILIFSIDYFLFKKMSVFA